MALYTVLRAFNGSGVVLQRGDIIDSEVFNMPYGRDNQLVEARYLTPSPVGSKSTIVPDASQLPESKHPKGSIKDTKISEQGAEVGGKAPVPVSTSKTSAPAPQKRAQKKETDAKE